MHVSALWRHPVKSMQGQSVATAQIDPDGLRGDRRWGVRDEVTGKVLTGRREPRLLGASAVLDADGGPAITLPDGTAVSGQSDTSDQALSAWLQQQVTLVGAADAPGGRAEFFADATDDSSAAIEWTMPPGRFVDALALLVLSTASLRTAAGLYPGGDWNVRRFRPNVLVDIDGDGWPEDGWCGATVGVGDAEITPQAPCVRCTMVTRPQPDIERDLDIYRTVARHHAGSFGAWAGVGAPGTVRTGDAVTAPA